MSALDAAALELEQPISDRCWLGCCRTMGLIIAALWLTLAGSLAVAQTRPPDGGKDRVEVWGKRPCPPGMIIVVSGFNTGCMSPEEAGDALRHLGHWAMEGGGRSPQPRASASKADNNRSTPAEETCLPVVLASGNKVLDETDFATKDGTFVFTRTYSRLGTGNGFGNHWRHPFSYVLTGTQRSGYGTCPPGYPPSGEPCPLGNRFSEIFAHRPDGVTYRYAWSTASNRYEDSRPESTSWIEEDEVWSDSTGNHDITTGRFTLRRQDGGREFYSGPGRILTLRDARGVGYTFTYALAGNGPLQTVTHTSGRQISLTFASGRFTSVTDPSGKVYTYRKLPRQAQSSKVEPPVRS